MNIPTPTEALKWAILQTVAEVQDARAIVIDVQHLLNHASATPVDCAYVRNQYSTRITLIEFVAFPTLLEAAMRIGKRRQEAQMDAPFDPQVIEVSAQEAMAFLQAWLDTKE